MERYELPDGWEWAMLGEVAKYINGRAFKPSDWEDEGLPIIRIQNLTNLNAKFNYYSRPVEDKYYVQNGDLLISWSATLDAFIWDRGLAILNQHIFRVEENSLLVDRRYLYYVVRAHLARLKSQVHGTGMQHITRGPFEATEIPLAPLAEQCRILAKIDALHEESRTAREELDRIPVLLKQYRQSVLTAAFRGELVERDSDDEPASVLLDRIRAERRRKWEDELRAKGKHPELFTYEEPSTPNTSELPELPHGWVWVRFEELVMELKNGYSLKPAYEPPGIPILRISAVRPLLVSFDDLRYVREENFDISDLLLQNGDLLFTRYNGSLDLVGACGMVRDLPTPIIYPDKLIRARVRDAVIPAYLELYFATAIARDCIEKRTKSSAGQQGISGKDIKDLPVALAPLSEQRRIVARIQELFAKADIVEETVEAARQQLDRLDQSVLARAFRGELVPQDPDDEPASALLERIRAERETQAGPKRGRKGRKDQSEETYTNLALDL